MKYISLEATCYFNLFANPSFFEILNEGVLKAKNVFAY